MFNFVVRVENYVPLIAAIARKYWLALPPEKKAWIDLEDFLNDGLIFARFELMPKYDIQKTKFTTYLTRSLQNFYLEKLIEHKRIKRTVSVYYRPQTTYINPIENEMAGEQGIKKLYDLASPLLKGYVDSWFFSPTGPARIRHGMRFTKAKKEFKKLAPVCGLDFLSCKALLEANRRKALGI